MKFWTLILTQLLFGNCRNERSPSHGTVFLSDQKSEVNKIADDTQKFSSYFYTASSIDSSDSCNSNSPCSQTVKTKNFLQDFINIPISRDIEAPDAEDSLLDSFDQVPVFSPSHNGFKIENTSSKVSIHLPELSDPIAPYREVALANHTRSVKLSFLPTCFILCVLVIRVIFHTLFVSHLKALSWFDGPNSRQIRKNLLLPSLTNQAHKSLPIKVWSISFMIPQRQEAIVMAVFALMTILPLCFGYYGLTGGNAARILGARSGIFVLSQLPFLYLFGGRNSILISLTGWSITVFTVYHKWVGRIMALSLLIHAVAYAVADLSIGFYMAEWSFPYMWFGLFSGIAAAIILVQAIHMFRERYYEIFLVTHIVFVLIFTYYGYLHVKIIVPYYLPFYWFAIGFWAVDRILRLYRIAFSGRATASIKCFQTTRILKMTIRHSGNWKYYPGCYCFLYVRGAQFWQAHPFTMYESVEGDLTLAIKVMNGLTSQIFNSCCDYGHDRQIGIALEGPYGSSHSLLPYHTRILIAGGIGFTALFAYAKEIALESTSIESHTIFIWIVRTREMIDVFADELEYIILNGIDVKLFVTEPGVLLTRPVKHMTRMEEDEECNFGSSTGASEDPFEKFTSSGRPDLETMISTEVKSSDGPVCTICCGPGALNDRVRNCVVSVLDSSVHRVDYFEDAFNW